MHFATKTWTCGFVVSLAILIGPRFASAGVDVALVPEVSWVQPGDEFDVTLEITQAGSTFNAYEALLEYDPQALTYVPTSPGTREGAYMRSACGNTQNLFSANPGQLQVTHVLLCAGTSLTGPGVLYRLRFRANADTGTATVRFERVKFYEAGFAVPVDRTTDAMLEIRDPTDTRTALQPHPLLFAHPNPCRDRLEIRYEPGTGHEVTLTLLDARGRLVRTLSTTKSSFAWDLSDKSGRRLPAGVYWLRATGPIPLAPRRIVLLD